MEEERVSVAPTVPVGGIKHCSTVPYEPRQGVPGCKRLDDSQNPMSNGPSGPECYRASHVNDGFKVLNDSEIYFKADLLQGILWGRFGYCTIIQCLLSISIWSQSYTHISFLFYTFTVFTLNQTAALLLHRIIM